MRKVIIYIAIIMLLASSGAICAQEPYNNIWALMVGVSNYQHQDISDLNYTVDDVTRFYDALVDANVCNAPRDRVYLRPMTAKVIARRHIMFTYCIITRQKV